jgi:spore germination protein GerM
MVTKRQRRTDSVRNKKTKKKKRLLLFSVMVVVGVVFLALFFITLFDHIYPPTSGKRTAAAKKERQEVTLYFSNENERYLVPETRFVAKAKEPEAQGAEIVKALLAGSKKGLVNTFPEKAGLKGIRMEGRDTLVVDFDDSLVANHPGGSTAEMATIYSLTNSLATNLPGIKKVRILIEGKPRESLRGHVALSEPFTLNREFIAPATAPKEG